MQDESDAATNCEIALAFLISPSIMELKEKGGDVQIVRRFRPGVTCPQTLCISS